MRIAKLLAYGAHKQPPPDASGLTFILSRLQQAACKHRDVAGCMDVKTLQAACIHQRLAMLPHLPRATLAHHSRHLCLSYACFLVYIHTFICMCSLHARAFGLNARDLSKSRSRRHQRMLMRK